MFFLCCFYYVFIYIKKTPYSSQMLNYLFISACECINQVLRCTHERTQRYSICTAEIVDWKKRQQTRKLSKLVDQYQFFIYQCKYNFLSEHFITVQDWPQLLYSVFCTAKKKKKIIKNCTPLFSLLNKLYNY